MLNTLPISANAGEQLETLEALAGSCSFKDTVGLRLGLLSVIQLI